MTYLDCPYAAFRRVLASCHDLPEEAWHRLDNDRELMVRRTAARRPDAPPEVLERLVRSHGEVFHIRPLLVDHPNFLVTRCARSSTNRARTCATSLCRTPNCP